MLLAGGAALLTGEELAWTGKVPRVPDLAQEEAQEEVQEAQEEAQEAQEAQEEAQEAQEEAQEVQEEAQEAQEVQVEAPEEAQVVHKGYARQPRRMRGRLQRCGCVMIGGAGHRNWGERTSHSATGRPGAGIGRRW
jgi:hypothetical protein